MDTYDKRKSLGPSSFFNQISYEWLLKLPPWVLCLGGEVILAHAAELTGKIFGKVFPFYAGLVFVVHPAANIADILHAIILLIGIERQTPFALHYIISAYVWQGHFQNCRKN